MERVPRMRGAGRWKRGLRLRKVPSNVRTSDAEGPRGKVREAALYGAIGGTREELSAVESAVTSATASDTTHTIEISGSWKIWDVWNATYHTSNAWNTFEIHPRKPGRVGQWAEES